MSRYLQVLAAAAAAALLVACGGSGGNPDGEPAPATSGASDAASADGGGGSTLSISGLKFSEVTAAPGAEVMVANADDVEHTVTADDDSFDVSVSGGGTATFTAPDAAGTYAIHCNIHPTMMGTVTVE